MTLTELRYIVAVAQERHFGRASERCCITQPALSLAIQKLEEEFLHQFVGGSAAAPLIKLDGSRSHSA